MKLRSIEILEKDQNKKGDLFGRLMADLFHSLGYDEPRLNIHKSGREIDLSATHRTEPKIAIAECKAHADTIGGADINKFAGALDVEKRKFKKEKGIKKYSYVGYFISLSGFKETAIEQENEINNNRVILIKPEKIVEELIRGRIIVSKEQAISSLSLLNSGLILLDYVDLLAYEKGWVWAFYYSNLEGQQATHFALVHAEGKPLIKDLAEGIITIDTSINGNFLGLKLINNNKSNKKQEVSIAETKTRYFSYLENELGEIQFEGLPTDKEAGSVKVQLENIFVPLHFEKHKNSGDQSKLDFEDAKREGIGKILNKESRLAILAKPGGGKSTLIKRIAIAYAFPERRNLINDKLPEKPWFPIFLRCRELGDKITQNITDIIHGIPARAEIHSCTDDFSSLVSVSLQNGSALLLIDGLDEIAEDKNRIAFVNQLRTFIATYPSLNIIVTSREAGFRVVAGSLASYCEKYTVSNLVDSEIKELCLKWHKAIIDDSENTLKEANKLSDIIIKDVRIKVLAENPLLLTTLLFVKRWAGYLPTKRNVLYQEMIKLLLVTWNVEGHEILDIEEAEPQLAFVAYWMTKNGQQTISADELNVCLVDARKQMPEILGYTNVSPSEFIKRVESRSSLLIMSGHKRLDSGIVSAVYEFLHLSFQEYLTAKAIVKRFIPHSDIETKVIDIIKPNIDKENWKEVIPLTAVLLEREAKDLVEYLILKTKEFTLEKRPNTNIRQNQLAASLLGNCLANEIQINPDTLEIAIEWFAKSKNFTIGTSITDIILKNKFGTTFRKKVKECFFEKYDDKYASELGSTLGDIFLNDLQHPENKAEILVEILDSLKSDIKERQCIAILGFMSLAFNEHMPKKVQSSLVVPSEIFDTLLKLIKTKDLHFLFSICWCIVWSSAANLVPEKQRIHFVVEIISIWTKSSEYHLSRVASWALSCILYPSIAKIKLLKIKKIEVTIQDRYDKPFNEFDKFTSVFIGTILGNRYEQKAMLELFNNDRDIYGFTESFKQFAKTLNVSIKE